MLTGTAPINTAGYRTKIKLSDHILLTLLNSTTKHSKNSTTKQSTKVVEQDKPNHKGAENGLGRQDKQKILTELV